MRNDCRASGLLAPLALIFSQQLRLILGAQLPIPVGELHGSSRETFLDINLPASDSDEAAGVGRPLTVALSEGPFQIGGLNTFASGIYPGQLAVSASHRCGDDAPSAAGGCDRESTRLGVEITEITKVRSNG